MAGVRCRLGSLFTLADQREARLSAPERPEAGLVHSVLRGDSGSRLVAVLLTPNQIDDGQNADSIENGDADEPGELVVARTLPHADAFPDAIPEGEENQYRNQQAEPDGEMVCVHVHGLARLSEPAQASSAISLQVLGVTTQRLVAAPPSPQRCLRFPIVLQQFTSAALAMLVFHSNQSRAEDLTIEEVRLPPLRIQGQAARAHTQGLELVAGKFYVTARREDVRPRRALLLRTDPARADWDVWDITPMDAQGIVTALDHPGGMQSDGTRLWIPLAESKRNGHSLIRTFQLTNLVAGRPIKSDFEFPVDDHIGALAVAADRQLVFGANWDTERVYVWDFKGQLQRTLLGAELKARGLGVVTSSEDRPGVAVQDWKLVGDRLFASGLFRAPGSAAVSPASRLIQLTDFLEPDFQRRTVTLPMRKGTELAREAMAISEGMIYFLPEDLGASNRMFRVAVTMLLKQSTAR
jgi:hypothetical protein